jgi:acetolactate synthase-1/2/3 large subunit
MAKGTVPFSHALSLGTVGLQTNDYVSCGFDRADLIVCVGYDIVEYHPELWHKDKSKKILHIDTLPAEVDEHYILEAGVVGDIGAALRAITDQVAGSRATVGNSLRQSILNEMQANANDHGFPIKPQKIIWDLRQVLAPDDIVISDVGAHKLWLARMYQAERPNTCIISNGFAAMGIAVPGALAAKLAYPERNVVAVTGDAGFLMNSQEIETAMRLGVPFVVLIWTDAAYGVIRWHQERRFGRASHVDFTNPDFVAYAESFGAKGYRVQRVAELVPTLREAIAHHTLAIIDCPVDYAENMRLTDKLGDLVCPT